MYSTSKSQSSGVSGFSPIIIILMFFVMTETGGCSINERRFQSAARNAGLVKATQGRYDYFECGAQDVWVAGFQAKRPTADKSGVSVSGTMCCGIFKGCTVRWQ